MDVFSGTGGLLLCLLSLGDLLPCLLRTGWLFLCLLFRGGLLFWWSFVPPWWAPGSSAQPWWSKGPICSPWWAPVSSAPPWWAPVSSAQTWWSPVSSVQPWWAPVLSAPPWYAGLPLFLVSSPPLGPGSPSLPWFHLRSTALLDCSEFGVSGSCSLGGALLQIQSLVFRTIATRGHPSIELTLALHYCCTSPTDYNSYHLLH